ncbi:MAG: hypothetical protein AAF827_15945 [Cyanobacteria bacterium P01_D01_bin.6]
MLFQRNSLTSLFVQSNLTDPCKKLDKEATEAAQDNPALLLQVFVHLFGFYESAAL